MEYNDSMSEEEYEGANIFGYRYMQVEENRDTRRWEQTKSNEVVARVPKTELKEPDWDKYENFSRVEFECHCGCGKAYMQDSTMEILQLLRKAIGRSIRVVSGYRCHNYNKRVGGKPLSAHLSGYAVDIAIPNSRMRYEVKKVLYDLDIKRIGTYQKKGFVHFDTHPTLPQFVEW